PIATAASAETPPSGPVRGSNHGIRSGPNSSPVGASSVARSNAPMWKCASFGSFSLLQVSVAPQRAQKPRSTPGDEAYFVISPAVIVTCSCAKDTNTDAGAPLCLRQLSQ